MFSNLSVDLSQKIFSDYCSYIWFCKYITKGNINEHSSFAKIETLAHDNCVPTTPMLLSGLSDSDDGAKRSKILQGSTVKINEMKKNTYIYWTLRMHHIG